MDYCRMYEAIHPDVNTVVMIRVDAIDQNRAYVSLPEYNNMRGIMDEPCVIGRIQPARVVSHFSYNDEAFVSLTTMDLTYNRILTCDRNFTKSLFVQSILRSVARQVNVNLEDVYYATGWPSYEELTHPNYTDSLSCMLSTNFRNALIENLARISLSTWRIKKPRLLSPCHMRRCSRFCWAFALIRQFEALLKLNNRIPNNVYLSVQDFINRTEAFDEDLIDDDGDIDDLPDVVDVLTYVGVVQEEHCPFINSNGGPKIQGVTSYRLKSMVVMRDSDYSADQWDALVEASRRVAPLVASVVWFPSYRNNVGGQQIYMPTENELARYRTYPHSHRFPTHNMLLTGSGVDENGIPFWELQDNNGDVAVGDRGFLRFAREPNLIFEIVEMEI